MRVPFNQGHLLIPQKDTGYTHAMSLQMIKSLILQLIWLQHTETCGMTLH